MCRSAALQQIGVCLNAWNNSVGTRAPTAEPAPWGPHDLLRGIQNMATTSLCRAHVEVGFCACWGMCCLGTPSRSFIHMSRIIHSCLQNGVNNRVLDILVAHLPPSSAPPIDTEFAGICLLSVCCGRESDVSRDVFLAQIRLSSAEMFSLLRSSSAQHIPTHTV